MIEILSEGRQHPQAAAAEQKQIEKLNAEPPQQAAEQKQIEKLNAEQPIEKPNAEPMEKQNAEPIEKQNAEQKQIEKQNAEPEAVATPSKKKKSRLPRVSDFLPQVPGPLGPKVDPSDF